MSNELAGSTYEARTMLFAATADALVRLKGISKIFHTERVETHALRNVDLDIREGEFVAISGPSGGGKTTLLSVLGLLESPSAGAYTFAGKGVEALDSTSRARIRNREIGFIFQAFNLIGDLTVYENVELPLTYRGMSAETRHERVMNSLDRVGMAARKDHYPAQLSGGQQQRAAVARAVAGEPRILLADEPTGNLDSANGESVMAILHELHAAGATICMVTHDPRYESQADRVIHLIDGQTTRSAHHS